MNCPSCPGVIEHGRCASCRGVWLTHEQVQQDIGTLERTGGTFSKRRCPMCAELMQEPVMFGVPLDHCLDHGYWFDVSELEEVIANSKSDVWRLYGTGVGTADAWRRYDGGETSNARWNPIQALIDQIRAWRK